MKNQTKPLQTLQSVEHNIILLGMGNPLDLALIYP